jgi:hypothetical protein
MLLTRDRDRVSPNKHRANVTIAWTKTGKDESQPMNDSPPPFSPERRLPNTKYGIPFRPDQIVRIFSHDQDIQRCCSTILEGLGFDATFHTSSCVFGQ